VWIKNVDFWRRKYEYRVDRNIADIVYHLDIIWGKEVARNR